MVLNGWDIDLIETFDPTTKPFRVDTIATGARFGALSPDGRFVAYQSTKTGEMDVLDRASKRRVQVGPAGTEPLWLSPTQWLSNDGGIIYEQMPEPLTSA